ncbi:MAG: anti-sigma-K factor RskA, partial [Limisphaerales bacterium]
MEILENIWQDVENYWRLVAEISILSVAIYYTLKFFRGTRGWPMVVALLGLIG